MVGLGAELAHRAQGSKRLKAVLEHESADLGVVALEGLARPADSPVTNVARLAPQAQLGLTDRIRSVPCRQRRGWSGETPRIMLRHDPREYAVENGMIGRPQLLARRVRVALLSTPATAGQGVLSGDGDPDVSDCIEYDSIGQRAPPKAARIRTIVRSEWPFRPDRKSHDATIEGFRSVPIPVLRRDLDLISEIESVGGYLRARLDCIQVDDIIIRCT